jgi:dolichyl-phosphate-mannose--protein O-mannosyl transferase
MPKLIRLYITHVAIGFAIAAAFVGMLLWFNVANLWHLVTHSDQGLLAVVILWFANGIVFAGVQFAIAVMRLKEDDDEPRGGLRQHVMRHDYATIPARADEDDARAFWQTKR